MYGQIFAVEAIDVDVHATIPPTWGLSTSPPGGPFFIDALGNINVIPPGLNFLDQPKWTITVKVTDAGGESDTQNLFIQVSDQNVGPIILNLPATKNISEDTAGSTLLFIVDPYDVDGDLAVCMFTPNPNDGSLEFNSTTYQIWLSNPPSLDHDITSKYEIIVRCNDGMATGPPARFTINILPVNKPPEILSLPATVTVPEDAINRANIFFVDGYDIDEDNLDFSIASVTPASGLGKFFISNADTQDADVGIVANPNFDYEDINQYIIVIEATDGEFTATGTLNVDITDVNEPPVFFINPQTLYLNENEPANTILNSVVLSVTDPDDGPANLTFAVVNSPESPFFKVSADPWLKVRKPMDYETDPTRFQIQVSVTDSASNTDHLIIDVHLVNLNDNPPIFTMDPYVGTVFESDPGGTSVLVVSATDADGDSIVYDIEPDSLYIEVDDITGEVRLKQPLNRETLGGMIQVTVIATDDGDPPLTGESYINITIKDVNDNAPVLTKEFYNWEIRHDADIGTYINRVTATDKDFGNNGLFTFSLLMDHVYFSIDDIGKVSVSDKLKAEMEYLIFCRAEDSGNPSETSDISVIRIDAFVPQLVLINVHLGIPVTDFTTAKRTAFLNTLNGLYPPWQFRISAVQSEDVVTSSTRRLLASNAVLEMYALQDDTTDNLDNVKLPKEFVHASTLVNSLTVDDAGTPSAVLTGTDIVLVEPTYPVEIVVDDTNWWLDTLEGNIVLGVLCSIGFLLLMIALIIFCWKCCCCGRGLSGFCARCCSNLCKKKTKNLDDRPYEWELQKKEEPDVDKQKMDTSDVPEPTETGPKKPLPKDDEIPVTPYGGGKFDFRYAGRPHPGAPQTLKAKDQPTLILAPSTPTRKSTGLNRTARTTPVLQRRGGRVSPEVSGDNDNVHVGNRSGNDSIFNGSAQDDVTTTHKTEEKKLDPSPHTGTPGWVTGTPDVDV
ncbi:cadherin EGF LAG seven-pass G-type receptor 2-like isoform X2 [Ptychodera flava]|uniref:cadherin EGF LAG seven-pass G-type receptor 2-like isoform X2 n=2 Tax=Ptychodera flava TaxID=63121 RepID=UPI003969D9B3